MKMNCNVMQQMVLQDNNHKRGDKSVFGRQLIKKDNFYKIFLEISKTLFDSILAKKTDLGNQQSYDNQLDIINQVYLDQMAESGLAYSCLIYICPIGCFRLLYPNQQKYIDNKKKLTQNQSKAKKQTQDATSLTILDQTHTSNALPKKNIFLAPINDFNSQKYTSNTTSHSYFESYPVLPSTMPSLINTPAPPVELPKKYSVTAFFKQISYTCSAKDLQKTAKMNTILSPFDKKINKLHSQRGYFSNNNENFTTIEYRERQFSYAEVKNKTIADFISSFRQEKSGKDEIKLKIWIQPKTYSFEFRIFNSSINVKQDEVSDYLTWENVLNNFRGKQGYFSQMDELTQHKTAIAIKSKSMIYGQIKDKKVSEIAMEIGLISLEEDSNSMNPIVLNTRMIGASLANQEFSCSGENEEEK